MLAAGFWRRSLDEFKRLSGVALRLEAIDTAKNPRYLASFSDPETLSLCKIMSDSDIGGFSTSHLDYHASTAHSPSHARFHGTISTDLPPNNPEIQRTGYAGWRTKDRGATIFGRGVWDVDPYAYCALRVRSDGRNYNVNVQTESIVPSDLHQHRLYARRPGEWETVLIPWGEFVRTNHGVVVQPQAEMLRQRVRSVGISLTDRIPGPFELCIARIWATNGLGPDDERGFGDEDGLDFVQPGESKTSKETPRHGKML
ncbi:MAG: hypothetical protein M1821_005252 [Bathelium mastoideum]|nr:MAG: hypothetical protein M1821_005252 [Bathelium mastoideum]KAI9689179.1 MAG: hypothetical protein M1822_000917 [Bathelium mastoideum]